MISVCVSTKNRPLQLQDCIDSILKSKYKDYEVVIADQSDNNSISKKYFSSKKVRYLKQNKLGLSSARNFLVDKAKGSIIAFTDDDCVVGKNWIQKIEETFEMYPKAVAIFGQTKPYKPEMHPGKFCPCTFKPKKVRVINKMCFHADHIGFGNNMAFRADVFSKHGKFKEWLGTGAIGESGEDAEFILRLLAKREKVISSSEVIVYHNRWLTSDEMRKQVNSYICGGLTCYGYLAFSGNSLGAVIVRKYLRENQAAFINLLKQFMGSKRTFFREIKLFTIRQIKIIKGLFLAYYYSYKDPFLQGRQHGKRSHKDIVFYCSSNPADTFPNNMLLLAKEISEEIPVIFVDLVEGAKRVSRWNRLIPVLSIIYGNKFVCWPYGVSLFNYFLRLYCFIKKSFGFRIIIISLLSGNQPIYRHIPSDVKIFDAMDQYYPMEFNKNLNFIKSFDKVFVNSKYFFNMLNKEGINPEIISTGYLDHPSDVTLKKKISKSVIYCGGISKRIDYNLLYSVVRILHDYNFFFIGEKYIGKYWISRFSSTDLEQIYENKWRKLLKFPNTHYFGNIPAGKLYTVLRMFEVGIIPYDIKDFFNVNSNPIKLYEYLITGLPVVSTFLPVVAEKNSKSVRLAGTPEEFARQIVEVRKENHNIKKHKWFIENSILTKKGQIISYLRSKPRL